DRMFIYRYYDKHVATTTVSTEPTLRDALPTFTAMQAATVNYNSGSIDLTLTVGKANPVLSGFTDINKFLTDASFTLASPVSNSIGIFSYSSSNPDVATITDNTVSINGVGVTTITA